MVEIYFTFLNLISLFVTQECDLVRYLTHVWILEVRSDQVRYAEDGVCDIDRACVVGKRPLWCD